MDADTQGLQGARTKKVSSTRKEGGQSLGGSDPQWNSGSRGAWQRVPGMCWCSARTVGDLALLPFGRLAKHELQPAL